MPAIWLIHVRGTPVPSHPSTARSARLMWASRTADVTVAWPHETSQGTPPALASDMTPRWCSYRSVPGASNTLTAHGHTPCVSRLSQRVPPLAPASHPYVPTLPCLSAHRTPDSGAIPATSSSGYNVFDALTSRTTMLKSRLRHRSANATGPPQFSVR